MSRDVSAIYGGLSAQPLFSMVVYFAQHAPRFRDIAKLKVPRHCNVEKSTVTVPGGSASSQLWLLN